MKNLKQRWGIRSNFHLLIIFIVFGITGSVSALLAEPLTHWLGLTPENTNLWLYWPIRILFDLPNLPGDFGRLWLFIWRVPIFWNFEKKMLSRMGVPIHKLEKNK